MVKVTAAEVNKLRKATGAGMMDCKNALVEAEGDFDKAIDVLRKKGQKVAAKRADRESSEGAAVSKINADNTAGVAIVLGCETDFVGKNDSFLALANELAEVALNYATKEEFLAADFNGMTVAEKLVEQTGVIGEKLDINGFEKLEAPFVSTYVHINKIAALVGLSAKVDKADILAKDVAMQVAAMNPVALTKDNVAKEVIDRELEIAKDQIRQEGKPEHMLEKIAAGKLNKFFKESTLLSQDFIKNNKINVETYVKELDKDITVSNFLRFSLA